MNNCEDFLNYLYKIEQDGKIGKLTDLARLTINASENSDFDLIDEILEKIDINKSSTLVLVALIRYTYRMNPFLKNWFSFKDKCMNKLIQREGEEKAKRLMIGIVEKNNKLDL